MGGFVYLLCSLDDDTYKIGITKYSDIERYRIKNGLQTGNPSEIVLVNKYKSNNYRQIETMLHRFYGTKHKRGEWFELESTEVLEFAKRCEDFDKTITILLKENHFYK